MADHILASQGLRPEVRRGQEFTHHLPRLIGGKEMQSLPIHIEDPTSEENCNLKENRINKWLCAFDHINVGKSEKVEEKKINEVPQKVFTCNSNKEIIAKTTNLGENSPKLNSDEVRKTHKKTISNEGKIRNESELLKGKEKDKERGKGLSSLVRRISNDEINSTAHDKWPSPEDIKKAYLELNLCPPSSPNEVR